MIRWKRKMRRALVLALAVCMAVSLLPNAAASADDNVDPAQEGKITLRIRPTSEYYKELENAVFDVDVYKVADIDASGRYTAVEPFAASPALTESLKNINLLTDMGKLADDVKAIIHPSSPEKEDGKSDAPAGEQPEELAVKPSFTVKDLPVVNGPIVFSDYGYGLGLYLVVPHEAKVDDHAYSFAAMLLSVPSLGTPDEARDGRSLPAEGDGEGDDSAQETESQDRGHLDWQYDYNVFLKPLYEELKGQLVVEKTLENFNASLGPVTFLFEITAVKDNETVYSNVVTLTFDGAGTKQTLAVDIPLGSTVTVREIYSGAAYRVQGTGTEVVVMPGSPADGEEDVPVITVSFLNDYNGGLNPSIGVVNRFTVTENGVGWDHEQVKDNSVEQGGTEE